MFGKVLVGYDDSPGARRALQIAVDLVREPPRGELKLVAVEERLPHYGATFGEFEEEKAFGERRCRRWLTAGEAYADDHGVPSLAEIRIGHAAQELLRSAGAWGAELVVLGHSGHSAVWGRFLGVTVEKVSRHARCSVLIAAPPQGR